MGPQEIRGVIGELCVLERLISAIGPMAALQAWVAPDDHPQDFALADAILEVKARLSGSRPHVQISSLEQLDLVNLPLNLVVVELAPAIGSSAFSLNDIVDRLLAIFEQAGVSARDAAEMALASRGYIKSDAYGVDCYTVAGMRAFQVTQEFPRLCRSTTDRAIHQAGYLLDLTALTAFERSIDVVLPSDGCH